MATLECSSPAAAVPDALTSHFPLCLPISEARLPDPWALLPEHTQLNVALSPKGIFYGAEDDAASPIGLRRVRPAEVSRLTWHALHLLLDYIVRREHGEAQLPDGIAQTMVDNAFDAFGDGSIALRALLAHNHTFYVNGKGGQAFGDAVAFCPLSPLFERLTRLAGGVWGATGGSTSTRWERKGAYLERRGAYAERLWVSAGGTSSTLHVDQDQSNWHCVLVGSKHFALYPPSDTRRMYPISYDQLMHLPDVAIDFQRFVRPDGTLDALAVPRQFRDAKMYAAVQEETARSEPDRFPAFESAQRTTVEVRAGECLFVPSFWWHQVTTPPAQISMAINMFFHLKPAGGRSSLDQEEIRRELLEARNATFAWLARRHGWPCLAASFDPSDSSDQAAACRPELSMAAKGARALQNRCEPYCAEPCSALNGNVRFECGACAREVRCNPQAAEFAVRVKDEL